MLCANLLSNEDTVIQLAQQMVAMAQYYNFDGWLVNIENPINVSMLEGRRSLSLLLCTCTL